MKNFFRQSDRDLAKNVNHMYRVGYEKNGSVYQIAYFTDLKDALKFARENAGQTTNLKWLVEASAIQEIKS